MHQFDALEHGAGRAKGLEAEHRSNDPFDGSVYPTSSAGFGRWGWRNRTLRRSTFGDFGELGIGFKHSRLWP